MTLSIKVTTESGRQYVIDDDLWRRLPKYPGEYTGGWNKVWSLKHGTHFSHPWDAPEGTWSDGAPVVGEFMHVGGKSEWWTSTMVVKVEPIKSERNAPITDPDDEFYTGCTEDCEPDCMADHKGEE